MKKSTTILLLALALVALLGGSTALYNKFSASALPQQQLAVEEGEGQVEESTGEADSAQAEPMKMPDFTVYDLEGNEVQLSDFIGKPVVLNFWASWCGPCQSEMPAFDEAYAQLGEDIHFLMVNMTDGSRETVETAAAFVESSGYAFPVYYDTALSAAMTYGVYSLPTPLFIDAQGRGIAQAVGAIHPETLQQGIDMIV